MKLYIKKIVLEFITCCCLIFYVPETKAQTNIVTIKNQIEKSFAKENLEQTRNLLFSSLIYYKKNNDTIGLCETWSKISIINRLLKQPYKAKAALKIAKSFSTDMNNIFLLLAEASDNKNLNNCLKFRFPENRMNDRFYTRLNYILRIYRLYENYDDKVCIKSTSKAEQELNALIEEISLRKDTLWFGYRKLLFEKGNHLIYRGDFSNCLGYFKRTIELSEKLESISYESLIAWSLIFRTCKIISNSELARIYFDKMVKVFEDGLIDKSLLGDYFWIKGIYFFSLDNYQEALNAIKLCNKFNDFYSSRNIFLIETHFFLDDYQNVIDLDSKYLGEKDAYYKMLLAYSYLKTNHIEIARDIERNIDKQKLIRVDNRQNQILIYLYKFYLETRRYKEAEHCLNIFLNKEKKHYGRNSFNTAIVYSYLGTFHWLYKNDIFKALQYYQKELSIYLRVPYHNDVFKLPDISKLINHDNLAICLRNKGEAFLELSKTCNSKDEKIKYLKACIDHFNLAFIVLNKYKFALLSEEKKLRYTNKTQHYYSYVIDACYRLYELTGEKKYANAAFEYIETSKASVLLSMIKGSGAKKLNMVPDKITDIENFIRDNTEKFTKLVFEENKKVTPDYIKIDSYNDRLVNLTKQQDSLLKELRLHYPAYYKLKYGAEVAGIASVQKKLTTGQVLLQYALANKTLYIMLVSKDAYRIFQEPIDSAFFTQVEQYRKFISGFDYADTKDNAIYYYADIAHALYDKLIAPFGNLIAGKEIIVIPDDILNTIPFESLITRKVGKGKHINYRDLPYLINQHPVIYNYSASLFAQTLQSERKAAHRARLLALAPINAEFTLSNIYNDEANRDSNYVAPIPGTIDEVKNVHKIFGGKLILGKKATEGKLKALSNQFDIIHIASHGFVNNNYPLYSKLVFNPDLDSINDGLLNTYEIYGMQISAPLVVLSACNTGYGKLYKGEGTVSLARGFYVAGAQNILMTLWSITDKTSNKLVQHFYTNLAEGETVPLSLQNAKLNFIQSADKISAHPFFWAGYISVGEPDVKFAKPQKNRLFLIIAYSTFAVLVITCIAYLLKKRRKQKIRPK